MLSHSRIGITPTQLRLQPNVSNGPLLFSVLSKGSSKLFTSDAPLTCPPIQKKKMCIMVYGF